MYQCRFVSVLDSSGPVALNELREYNVLQNSVIYIQLSPFPCASLAADLPMFTYVVTHGVSVSVGLGFEDGTVGGLQNLFCGRSLTSKEGFSDWVMQDVSHHAMIHSICLLSLLSCRSSPHS